MTAGPKYDLIIQNGSYVYGSRTFHIHVCIKDGKIMDIINARMPLPRTEEIYDASRKEIMPGLIDPHVHLNLRVGEHRSVDDFRTGSIAAAYGGITTFFDFTDVINGGEHQLEEFVQRRKKETEESVVNTQLHLAVAEPDIRPADLVHQAIKHKMRSIKVFTTYSSSGRMTNDGYLYELFKATKGTKITVMVHAENDGIIEFNKRQYIDEENLRLNKLPMINTDFTEKEAVLRVCQMAVDTKSTVYIAHVSSGRTVERVNECFGPYLGKNIFLETAPHYLYLNDTFLKGDNAHLYTCLPPLREERDRLLLREQLLNGLVNTIGTDHCPFTREMKEAHKDNLLEIPYGLPGIELSFSLLYNLMMLEQSSLTIEDLYSLFSTTPAKVFGYYPMKGTLFPGSDADITIYDPEHYWKIGPDTLHMNTDYTPYDGMMLRGKVDATICGGRFVLKNKELVESLVPSDEPAEEIHEEESGETDA